MRKKPQPPKEKPDIHSTSSVSGLMAILGKYPKDAKVYCPDLDWIGPFGKVITPDLIVWQGKKTLAIVTLMGF
jgi:hypothetical protein